MVECIWQFEHMSFSPGDTPVLKFNIQSCIITELQALCVRAPHIYTFVLQIRCFVRPQYCSTINALNPFPAASWRAQHPSLKNIDRKDRGLIAVMISE